MAMAIRWRSRDAPDHCPPDQGHVCKTCRGDCPAVAGWRYSTIFHGKPGCWKLLNMEIATYLLFVLGLLGAADIAIFHSVAHGIRSHPDSAMELFTHSLRGPTYAALFILIPNFK